MKKKFFVTACLLVLIALFTRYQIVSAHETITVGPYEIEVGWLTEPPIAGQQNAIVVNITDTSSGDAQPVEDVSSLTVTVSYGGQSKTLTLQPLGEDTPGQFVAPILPTIPGEYEVIFGGTLGDTAVDAETHVEEVEPADTLAFPSADSTQPSSAGSDWLVWLSLLIGLIGVGVGVTALRKASMR
jgi:hypothetical protein